MEKDDILEKDILFEIKHFMRLLPLPQEESAKFVYEMVFLRLLSLKETKEVASREEYTLEDFIIEYRNWIEEIKEDSFYSKEEGFFELKFKDYDYCLTSVKRILNDIERYKYTIRNIRPLLSLFCSYNGEILKNIMSYDLYENNRFVYQTPDQICKIANVILDINSFDEVLDIGSGCGNFLINANQFSNCKKITGIEINQENSFVSQIRLLSLCDSFDIINDDIFKFHFAKKFNKIFCNFPFGYKIDRYEFDNIINSMGELRFDWNKISNSSMDWLFINRMLSLLEKNGKAVAIMMGGSLFKVSDELYRKDLIDNGCVEMIIKIPSLSNYTMIDQYLVIFSTNNNSVKFVDLSSQFERKSFNKYDANMSNIFNILDSDDSKYVARINNEVIAKNGYLLTVDNYVGKKEIKYHNPRKLSDFILDSFRGYQMTSQEQEELKSENGEFEVLTISDIENGIISDNLIRIDVKDNKYERYLLKENDLIISSKGTRIKIAVVNNIDDRKIIANGNLIVLRLDTKYIDPYYLEMYLNSSDGQTILNQIQTGSIIISINPGRLKDITISTLPIEIQHKITDKYKMKQMQLLMAKEHVKKLEREQSNFFEDEVMEFFD